MEDALYCGNTVTTDDLIKDKSVASIAATTGSRDADTILFRERDRTTPEEIGKVAKMMADRTISEAGLDVPDATAATKPREQSRKPAIIVKLANGTTIEIF